MNGFVSILLLLALAFISGCAGTPIMPTANRTEFSVKVNVVTDAHMACVAANAEPRRGFVIEGCSLFNSKTNTLEMWVVAPSSLEDSHSFSNIGHEFWHGVQGKFHK